MSIVAIGGLTPSAVAWTGAGWGWAGAGTVDGRASSARTGEPRPKARRREAKTIEHESFMGNSGQLTYWAPHRSLRGGDCKAACDFFRAPRHDRKRNQL